MRCASISVWCDPWLVQVVSNFFFSLIVVHRVHCSERHRLPVPFETYSSWDQSTTGYWIYFTYIPVEEWGFKEYWNLFFGPPFDRKAIQALTGHCEVPSNFALNSSIMSSNRTAPSSSRRIDGSCRSNLIMAFDTAEQSLRIFFHEQE